MPASEAPTLPPELLQQALYRRDRLEVFGDVSAPRTALLVLNLQNAWLGAEAPFRACAPGQRAGWLARIHAFAARLRAAGGTVVWARTAVGAPGTPAYWGAYYDHFIEPVKRARAVAALAAGSAQHALSPEAQPVPGDWHLDKYRFSAFARADYDLEQRLRGAGIDTVVVAGTATNICCESTVRDALMRDFRCFMPHDLVACPTEDGHLAGLRSVMQAFADVRDSASLPVRGGT